MRRVRKYKLNLGRVLTAGSMGGATRNVRRNGLEESSINDHDQIYELGEPTVEVYMRSHRLPCLGSLTVRHASLKTRNLDPEKETS